LGLCIFLFTTLTLIPTAHAAVTGQQILSPSSAAWEASIIWRPVVINTGSSFMMWYSGENNNGIDNIGLATSKDGISWSRYPQNPVLSIGSPGQWDDGSANEAWVIQESGQYKMWYSGQTYNSRNNTILTYSIGYATSPDGIHWTKYPGNPIFTPGVAGSWDDKFVFRPIIVSAGSSYTMYYRGETAQKGQTGIATSTDGIHWTRTSALPPIPKGTWDAYSNSLTSITVTPGGYLMAYHGVDTQKSTHWKIGFASSIDGISLTPYTNNPVIAPEIGAIAWDSGGVSYPMVIPVGDKYYAYYSGYTSAIESVGLAILPTSQFPVPEFAPAEVLVVAVMLTSAAFLIARRRLTSVAEIPLDRS
jgi:predicted GH43/DUF377 family glycosyl hydrolase